MSVSTSLKLALLAGTACLSMVAAIPAAAQDGPAPAATDPAASDDDGDIVVTGTRVVRDGYEAPMPLTVLTQEEIQNTSPTNNIADFVNQLPQLAGSTRPSNSRLNISSGQAGINALSLRNFGETRTLILLNGRRSVASTITGVVDVNTIPQMLVERVDVATGGASASYGSDAVAGVVNFILDNDFEGLKVDGDTGITTYGDGFNYSFSAAGGLSFADDRGHLVVSGEFAHRDGIFNTNDREWNQRGFVRFEDAAWTFSSPNPRFTTRLLQVGAANSTPGGLITGSAGGVANRLRGTYFGDGGQVLQFQYGARTFPSPAGTAAPTLTQGGSWQVNDSGRRIGLDPEDDRRSVFGRFSFDVTDGVTLFAEASYNWQEVFFNAGPNLSTGQTLTATGCGAAATAAAAPITCNAFLYNALGPAALAGITSVTLATTAADLPFRVINNRREVQRYVIGAEGDFDMFGNEARWDVYGQYGRADLREQLRNIMITGPADNRNKLANATNVAFAQAGNPRSYAIGSIQCVINLDANTTNDDAACVPLNRLGIGVASAEAIDYVLGDPYRDQVVEQTVVGANLSLTPFATWAGDVSVAIGGEYRKEQIDGFVPQEFQPVINRDANGNALSTTNLFSVGNYLPSKGSFDVKEAYLETVIPLGFGLEFNGAVRATDYSTSGYVTTWRAGATWQPIDDIRLRVTRSRDIRAPNLNELFAAGTANTDSVSNPFFSAATGTATPLNGVVYNTASISYSGLAQGNLNLGPEKADSWNVGGVISPRFIPGFSASADYFRIDLDGAIDSLGAQNIINFCFQGRDTCSAITQDPNNAARILIRTQPFNFQRRLVRGIDFEASYRTGLDRLFPEAEGNLIFRGLATHYLENIIDTGIAGAAVLDTTGVNGGQSGTPSWIYRFSATYDAPTFSVTGVGRGVSAGRYVANGIECEPGTCPTGRTAAEASAFPTYDDNTVSGAFYVDLNTTFKFDAFGDGRRGEFFVNVTNVFNATPILLPETGLAANSTYSDLLGRAFRVGVRLKLR